MTTESTSDRATRARFVPYGSLALDPQAFGLEFTVPAQPAEPFERRGDVAIVKVSGPLSYTGGLFTSYAQVLARVEAALASDASAVVLHLDTPGGDVAGAFDTANALRAHAAARRLIAYSDSQACSAGYALACGCDRIVVTATATLGSIGVIAATPEASQAEKAAGVTWTLVTSGARKADGNVHTPLTDEGRDAIQLNVDDQASVFFDLVREARGINAAELEGASFVGARAKAKGLADAVMSLDDLCAWGWYAV
jgi:ClpP class serine protease